MGMAEALQAGEGGGGGGGARMGVVYGCVEYCRVRRGPDNRGERNGDLVRGL